MQRLEYYRVRDGHRMKVVNTFDDWEIGKRTQWTSPTPSGAERGDYNALPPLLQEMGFSGLCAEGVTIPKVSWNMGEPFVEGKYKWKEWKQWGRS